MFRPLVLVALLLAAPAAAQSIDSINGIPVPFADPPNDIVLSSIGTQLTLVGSGFGGTTGLAKPKVFTSSVALPKHRALKVVSFTDTELVVQVKAGVPGDFDLTVQPKGADQAPLVADDAVRLVTPTFEQPSPAAAGPGALVTLDPFFGPGTFGTKKGKVKVGGKKAKVMSWGADQVVFKLPAKLANGIYVVEAKNKIGTGTVEDGVAQAPYCMEMEGSAFDVGGPDRFSCKVDKKKHAATGDLFSILAFYETDPMPQVTISAVIQAGFPQLSMTVVVPVDLELDTFPLVVPGSADGKVDLSETEGLFELPTVWSTDFDGEGSDDWFVLLQSYEPNAETGGTQLAGTFVAGLQLVSAEGEPAAYEVTLGDFRVTVDP